ncbi:hypothetical protein ABZ470_39445 [Streptosporangium sp. NPDC020072]|uniref:hypothetical protein n=1 Tax=Streptosporangium sp. NPDC020072 TaxID=3154788 RepID=UPI00341ADE53
MPERPSVGSFVHYVSRGSADGIYPAVCRTAVITEVDPDDDARVGVCVFNPTGLYFHPLDLGGCAQAEEGHHGGTWHWPERV